MKNSNQQENLFLSVSRTAICRSNKANQRKSNHRKHFARSLSLSPTVVIVVAFLFHIRIRTSMCVVCMCACCCCCCHSDDEPQLSVPKQKVFNRKETYWLPFVSEIIFDSIHNRLYDKSFRQSDWCSNMKILLPLNSNIRKSKTFICNRDWAQCLAVCQSVSFISDCDYRVVYIWNEFGRGECRSAEQCMR